MVEVGDFAPGDCVAAVDGVAAATLDDDALEAPSSFQDTDDFHFLGVPESQIFQSSGVSEVTEHDLRVRNQAF